MKNVLFSGLSYSKENTDKMIRQLEREGVPNVIDFGPYYCYEKYEGEKLLSYLCNSFDNRTEGDDVNIICHSMGCNMGLILAKERSSQIKKAVFISPELRKSTRKEKQIADLRIKTGIAVKYDFSNEKKVKMGVFDKIKLYEVFKQTRKIALENLDSMSAIDSLVIYGAADKFVSQESAEELAEKLDAYIIQARTKYHNVLLAGVVGAQTARSISRFINDDLTEHETLGYRKRLKK